MKLLAGFRVFGPVLDGALWLCYDVIINNGPERACGVYMWYVTMNFPMVYHDLTFSKIFLCEINDAGSGWTCLTEQAIHFSSKKDASRVAAKIGGKNIFVETED